MSLLFQTYQVSCKVCDYEPECKEQLKINIDEKHSYSCDICIVTVKRKAKLKNHICKVHEQNSTSGSLYMKQWYDVKGCNGVYCMRKTKGTLHSKACWYKKYPCLSTPLFSTKVPIGLNRVLHLEIESLLIDGEVLWPSLMIK